MSDRVTKKVLIEQAELDRLQQRQLRDYSPELHSLARVHSQIGQVLGRKNLSAEQKLNLLTSYQTRFDKLQKETGALSGSHVAPFPQLPGPRPQIKPRLPLRRQRARNDHIQSTDEEEEEEGDGDDEVDFENARVKQLATDEQEEADDEHNDSSGEPLRGLTIQPMFRAKAERLMQKILGGRNVLTRNDAGEMVIDGHAEPGTNFNQLFENSVKRGADRHLPGIEKFFHALKRLGVRPEELSGHRIQERFRNLDVKGQLAARREQEHGQLEYNVDEELELLPTHSPKQKRIKPLKPLSLTSSSSTLAASSSALPPKPRGQQGTGFPKPPPGCKPNILYVY